MVRRTSGNILLHLDVDVIDPGKYPSGNFPCWKGVGFTEIMTALKLFLKSTKVGGLLVAEVNPDHDPGLRMTSRLVDEVVQGFKGRMNMSIYGAGIRKHYKVS